MKAPLSRAIYCLVSRVWTEEEIPDEWNEAVVVPVPKKSDLNMPGPYRAISLISTLCKLLTEIVADRISTICEQGNILISEQSGFLRLEECVAHATSLYEIGRSRILKGISTYIAFLDFSKAYNRVPHEELLAKLQGYGFHGKFLNLVRHYT